MRYTVHAIINGIKNQVFRSGAGPYIVPVEFCSSGGWFEEDDVRGIKNWLYDQGVAEIEVTKVY